MSPLTIALTKGRILDECLPLLRAAGIEPLDSIAESRKLIFATNQPGVRLLVMRGTDVPTYVRHGAADCGWPPSSSTWPSASMASVANRSN